MRRCTQHTTISQTGTFRSPVAASGRRVLRLNQFYAASRSSSRRMRFQCSPPTAASMLSLVAPVPMTGADVSSLLDAGCRSQGLDYVLDWHLILVAARVTKVAHQVAVPRGRRSSDWRRQRVRTCSLTQATTLPCDRQQPLGIDYTADEQAAPGRDQAHHSVASFQGLWCVTSARLTARFRSSSGRLADVSLQEQARP